MSRGLHDLLEIVVEVVRQRGRTRGGIEAEQASLGQRARLRSVERPGRSGSGVPFAGAGIHGGGAQPGVALSRLGLHRRHLAVRRIDQDGAARLSVDFDELPALLEPEPVVAARPPAGKLLDLFEPRLRRDALAADRGRFAIAADRRGVLGLVLAIVGLGRRRLLIGERRPAFGFRRPLERRGGRDVIHPLEIGMAIDRAWLAGGGTSRRGPGGCFSGRFGGLRVERSGGANCRDRNQHTGEQDGVRAIPHEQTLQLLRLNGRGDYNGGRCALIREWMCLRRSSTAATRSAGEPVGERRVVQRQRRDLS